MSAPPVVGVRDRKPVLAALTAGQMIVIPSDGGYQMAVSPTPDGVALLGGLSSRADIVMVVARRAQATGFTMNWSKEARLLTDRMWPGPLTVIVPAVHDLGVPAEAVPGDADQPVVHITMPSSRALRAVCREGGPLATVALWCADGHRIVTADEVRNCVTDADVALIVDGGTCDGPGPTVVDCTVSPPMVRRVGILPESYVDAALLMGNRRRRWFVTRA